MNLKQIFAYECVTYHYNKLRNLYLTSTSTTRNKLIIPPKCSKTVSNEDNYIRAIQVYNGLPKTNPNLKALDISKNYNKKKIKLWIGNNIL